MTTWDQGLLFAPEIVEFRIRLGVVAETDHAQLLVEVVEPRSKAVLAQYSRPHFPISHSHEVLDEAIEQVHEYFHQFVQPF